MIHAEANCLSLFRSGECKLLAVTLLPCSYCATMIAAYKIPAVVYSEIYDRDPAALEIFNFYKIKLTQITS
jgi:deoxycytidylate deaminase